MFNNGAVVRVNITVVEVVFYLVTGKLKVQNLLFVSLFVYPGSKEFP